jgi:nitrogen regulatory protein P-II 1
MKELVIIVNPQKLETVKGILDAEHVGGITMSNVMGCGTQRGIVNPEKETLMKGFKTSINLLPKIRIEVVVRNEEVENLILKIRDALTTTTVGGGKIFIRNIEETIRIRTGESGEKAL